MQLCQFTVVASLYLREEKERREKEKERMGRKEEVRRENDRRIGRRGGGKEREGKQEIKISDHKTNSVCVHTAHAAVELT